MGEDGADTEIKCPNGCETTLREAWPIGVRYCPECSYQEPA